MRTAPSIPPVPGVLAAILSVQGGAAVAKGLFPALGAVTTAGARIALSAAVLLLVFRPRLLSLTARQWKALVPFGVVLGAMNCVFYLSLSRIPLGLAVTLEFTGPLSVALLGARRPLDFAWVTMAAAGIALIAPWQPSGIDPLGVLFALLAGACWAAYILLGARLSGVLPGGPAAAVAMLIATLTVLPLLLLDGGAARFTPWLLLLALAVALLSSALPYVLEINALAALPARTFSILMSLEPAAAALCGLLFLREHLRPAQWVAIGLVIGASIGTTLTKAPAPVRDPI